MDADQISNGYEEKYGYPPTEEELALKTLPAMPQPPDSLEELSNLITQKLKKWDCFDFDVTLKRLNAVKKIIKGRGLEWQNMHGADEHFVYQDVVTIVIGVPGADFEDHERRR